MRSGKPPTPRRLGGRRDDASLLLRASHAFVEQLPNLLRLGLVAGGLWFVTSVTDRIRVERVAPEEARVETPVEAEDVSTDDVAKETFMSDGVRHWLKCTEIEYRRQNRDACVPDESTVYTQDKDFRNDGTMTILDVETLYAEAH